MDKTDLVPEHNPRKKYQVTMGYIQNANALQDRNDDLELENSLLKQMHDAASSTHQIWVRVLLLIDALSLSNKKRNMLLIRLTVKLEIELSC